MSSFRFQQIEAAEQGFSGIEAVPFDIATRVPEHLICYFPRWYEAPPPLRQRNLPYSGNNESFQSLC